MKKRLDLLGIDEDDFLFSMDGPKSDSRFEPINALNANETGAEKLKSLVQAQFGADYYYVINYNNKELLRQDKYSPRWSKFTNKFSEIDEQLVIEDTLSDTEIVEMAGFRRRYAN
ncbi:12558_t:CDS:2 [Entrophospora sp. SA101]|nr:12558_t:CDS:2 [Entrophospora sp. SA101]